MKGVLAFLLAAGLVFSQPASALSEASFQALIQNNTSLETHGWGLPSLKHTSFGDRHEFALLHIGNASINVTYPDGSSFTSNGTVTPIP